MGQRERGRRGWTKILFHRNPWGGSPFCPTHPFSIIILGSSQQPNCQLYNPLFHRSPTFFPVGILRATIFFRERGWGVRKSTGPFYQSNNFIANEFCDSGLICAGEERGGIVRHGPAPDDIRHEAGGGGSGEGRPPTQRQLRTPKPVPRPLCGVSKRPVPCLIGWRGGGRCDRKAFMVPINGCLEDYFIYCIFIYCCLYFIYMIFMMFNFF